MLVTTQFILERKIKTTLKINKQCFTFIFPQQMELHRRRESVFSDLITKQDVLWKIKS